MCSPCVAQSSSRVSDLKDRKELYLHNLIQALHHRPSYTVKIILEPRHDKTYLWEFPTRPDTNWPPQPQKLVRVLKFRL